MNEIASFDKVCVASQGFPTAWDKLFVMCSQELTLSGPAAMRIMISVCL